MHYLFKTISKFSPQTPQKCKEEAVTLLTRAHRYAAHYVSQNR